MKMPKLREYKGLVYDRAGQRQAPFYFPERQVGYSSISTLIFMEWRNGFSDDDYEALLDLKNNPYEPTSTLEDIVDEWSRNSCGAWPQMRDDLCDRIREAFQLIDANNQSTNDGSEWPTYVMIRDTKLHDDLGGGGQRIFTTAGNGYEKRKYIRDDIANNTLTVKDHVDALIKMGAKYYSGEHPFMEGYPRLVLPKVK
jgi:hypothetical protein